MHLVDISINKKQWVLWVLAYSMNKKEKFDFSVCHLPIAD